jgi:hypothetical protein
LVFTKQQDSNMAFILFFIMGATANSRQTRV